MLRYTCKVTNWYTESKGCLSSMPLHQLRKNEMFIFSCNAAEYF